MAGEVWTYNATKPNDGLLKTRSILIVGNDLENGLKYVDINYVIISSSADCGKYDVKLNDAEAQKMGLTRSSVIKTTKIYTGSQSKLLSKVGTLTDNIKKEFIQKYSDYQTQLISNFT